MGVAANVIVGGAGGKIYFAPAGATLPTTATSTPAAGFNDLGLISEDGVSEPLTESSTNILAWGGDTVRNIRTEHTYGIGFAMLETNPDTLEVYYGEGNVDDTLNVVHVKAGAVTRGAWIVDVVDGDGVKRIVVPDGEVTEHEDVTETTDSPSAYGVTVTAYPDGSGDKARIYFSTPGIS